MKGTEGAEDGERRSQIREKKTLNMGARHGSASVAGAHWNRSADRQRSRAHHCSASI